MKSSDKGLVRQAGFSLLELSIALLVIAAIMGVVTVGADLQRNASYQQLGASFVRGWKVAYDAHFAAAGIVPGDSPTVPTLQVNEGDGEYCSTDLRNAMLAAGVELPQGRAEGMEHHYGYIDSNGNPQDAEVCFDNVSWSVAGATSGSYVVQNKNVMIIKRITPDLARMLDKMIDGVTDARFGNFRESSDAADTTTASEVWSIDNRYKYGEGAPSSKDESQVAVLTGYYLMNP